MNKRILNHTNNRGDTVLHLACQMPASDAREEAIKLLIASGINIDIKNADGKTARDLISDDRELLDVFDQAVREAGGSVPRVEPVRRRAVDSDRRGTVRAAPRLDARSDYQARPQNKSSYWPTALIVIAIVAMVHTIIFAFDLYSLGETASNLMAFVTGTTAVLSFVGGGYLAVQEQKNNDASRMRSLEEGRSLDDREQTLSEDLNREDSRDTSWAKRTGGSKASGVDEIKGKREKRANFVDGVRPEEVASRTTQRG